MLLSTERSALEPLVGGHVLSMATPGSRARCGARCAARSGSGSWSRGSLAFAPACREATVRLGISKLVWIDRDGGIVRANGERVSFVHLDELREILAAGAPRNERRAALLREVEAMLVAGVPAVNVCTLEGLPDELFTYAGSGTLFTEQRYVVVRKLGLDDFDAASDLIARGTSEGYLAPRSQEQLDAVLASGFGAFVEGYHLAGIGALLVDEPARLRRGRVAVHADPFPRRRRGRTPRRLRAGARARARARLRVRVHDQRAGRRRSSSCTASASVGPEGVAPAKWRGYDPERRALRALLPARPRRRAKSECAS